MATRWTIDTLQAYMLSKTHHGQPGLSSRDKLALVHELEGEAEYWAPILANSPLPTARQVAAQLLGPLWLVDPNWERVVLALADDPDWEVREWVVDPFRLRFQSDPEGTLPQFLYWAETATDPVKRALAVALRHMAKSGGPSIELLLMVADRLALAESPYVRKNLGPFCIGDGLLPCDPPATLPHLAQWAERPQWAARWNAAAALGATRSRPFIASAQVWLAWLVTDGDGRVARQAQKVLQYATRAL